MVTVPEETEPAIPLSNTNTSKPTKMKARRSAPPSVCPSFRRDQLLVTNRAILERETPGQQQQHQQPSARKAKSLSPRPQRRRHSAGGAGEGGGLIYNNQANRKHRSPLPELPTMPFVSSVPISSKRVTMLSIRMSSKHEATTTSSSTKTKNIGNDHNTTTKQHEFARVHYVGTKRRESTKKSSSKLASKNIESRAELNKKNGAEAGRAEEMMAQIQPPPIIAAASTTVDHDDTAAAASATTTKTEEAQPQREKPVLSFAWDDVSSHKADDQRRNDTNTVIPSEPKIVITDPSTNNASKEFVGCMILLQEQTKKLQQYKNTTKQQHNKMTLYASNPIVLRKNSSSSIPHRKKIQYTNDISLWLQPWASIHYYAHTRKYDLVIGGIENYVIMKIDDKKSSSRFSKLFGGTKQQQPLQISAYHILWKPTKMICATCTTTTSDDGNHNYQMEIQPGFDGGLLSCMIVFVLSQQ